MDKLIITGIPSLFLKNSVSITVSGPELQQRTVLKDSNIEDCFTAPWYNPHTAAVRHSSYGDILDRHNGLLEIFTPVVHSRITYSANKEESLLLCEHYHIDDQTAAYVKKVKFSGPTHFEIITNPNYLASERLIDVKALCKSWQLDADCSTDEYAQFPIGVNKMASALTLPYSTFKLSDSNSVSTFSMPSTGGFASSNECNWRSLNTDGIELDCNGAPVFNIKKSPENSIVILDRIGSEVSQIHESINVDSAETPHAQLAASAPSSLFRSGNYPWFRVPDESDVERLGDSVSSAAQTYLSNILQCLSEVASEDELFGMHMDVLDRLTFATVDAKGKFQQFNVFYGSNQYLQQNFKNMCKLSESRVSEKVIHEIFKYIEEPLDLNNNVILKTALEFRNTRDAARNERAIMEKALNKAEEDAKVKIPTVKRHSIFNFNN